MSVDFFKKYFPVTKKNVIILSLLVFGIFLIVFSSAPAASQSNSSVGAESLQEYKTRLEGELVELCSSVSGVGKCRVTVSFSHGGENTYKGSMLVESKPPRVMGVTVVCKGGDSDVVRAQIVDMMSSLFDIGANRIAVLKLNS